MRVVQRKKTREEIKEELEKRIKLILELVERRKEIEVRLNELLKL